MKTLLSAFMVLLSICSLNAKDLYSKAYGNPDDKAAIFLHGGPGYNSVNFEVSTSENSQKVAFM